MTLSLSLPLSHTHTHALMCVHVHIHVSYMLHATVYQNQYFARPPTHSKAIIYIHVASQGKVWASPNWFPWVPRVRYTIVGRKTRHRGFSVTDGRALGGLNTSVTAQCRSTGKLFAPGQAYIQPDNKAIAWPEQNRRCLNYHHHSSSATLWWHHYNI